MIQRYHLDLAVVALTAGVVVLWATSRAPVAAKRAVALAGVVGALLGSLTASRGIPWVVVAALVLLAADRPGRPHPLGRLTPILAVIALAGIWTAVPDTEPAVAVGFVLLPVALAHFSHLRAPGPAATLAVVVMVIGAAWTGSAGWGTALAAMGAVGLIATAPLVCGFGAVRDPARLGVLVGLQCAVGLLLPRFVAFRSVPVAAMVSIGVNITLVFVTFAVVGPGRNRVGAEAPAEHEG